MLCILSSFPITCWARLLPAHQLLPRHGPALPQASVAPQRWRRSPKGPGSEARALRRSAGTNACQDSLQNASTLAPVECQEYASSMQSSRLCKTLEMTRFIPNQQAQLPTPDRDSVHNPVALHPAYMPAPQEIGLTPQRQPAKPPFAKMIVLLSALLASRNPERPQPAIRPVRLV